MELLLSFCIPAVRIVVDSGEPAQLKRERFIFKPVHVRLLEKYFQLDPYPNISKREEMARILNHAYLAHKGSMLEVLPFV